MLIWYRYSNTGGEYLKYDCKARAGCPGPVPYPTEEELDDLINGEKRLLRLFQVASFDSALESFEMIRAGK